MRRALLVLLVLLAVPVVAQEGRPPYTEVEGLRVENLALEKQIVVRAMLDWQKKALTLKADVEKARPGWVFNPEDGSWTKAK